MAGRAPGGEVASTLATAAGAGSRRPDLAVGAAGSGSQGAITASSSAGSNTDDPAVSRSRALQMLVERLRTAERVLSQRAGPVDAAGGGGASSSAPSPAPVSIPAAPSDSGNGASGDSPTAWVTWTRTMLDQHLRELSLIGAIGASDGAGNSSAPVSNGGPSGEAGGGSSVEKDGQRSVTWRQLARTSTYAEEQVRRLDALAARAEAYVQEMDFRFLYDERRKLFSIGYVVNSSSLDSSFYDLLASEARLASYLAIAKGDVPVEHWFNLGRSLTTAAGDTALISWSGSMFEYLMPSLVMESFPFTLLDQTYHGAVARQIAYGRERSVPWGVSESAFNARDRNQIYQYRAFGVPDLALKRGLSRDLVVAPYATLLALAVVPHQAMRNLASLEGEGALGIYGFRDAVDYTRPVAGTRRAVVGAYMAHHIGMGLAALNNAINRNLWRRRFHQEAMVKSAELVLFERIPRRFVMQEAQTREDDERPRRGGPVIEKPAARSFDTAATPRPRLTWLGHAPYTVMLTNGGGGYSRFEGLDVTRWRADGTLDQAGQWCYLKDVTPPSPDGPA
jgi:hypothetical protein